MKKWFLGPVAIECTLDDLLDSVLRVLRDLHGIKYSDRVCSQLILLFFSLNLKNDYEKENHTFWSVFSRTRKTSAKKPSPILLIILNDFYDGF